MLLIDSLSRIRIHKWMIKSTKKATIIYFTIFTITKDTQKEQSLTMSKNFLFIVLLILICTLSISCASSSEISSNEASDIPNDASELSYDNNSEEEIETDNTDINISTTYQNPLLNDKTSNAWENYGFGDPFVMRYNGKYYLYVSTKDEEIGIKVWTSDNLIDWEYEGICAADERTKSAYAPEVVYYNGNFYMYTSPAGNGHYVLKASDPLGPFEIITENLGNSIDGHVFIDDDGKWYFYHAWEGAIKVKELSSPTDLLTEEISIGIDVARGWTEGPMVIKQNGIYYLTYCGNHVWSKGYRIEGAVSTTTPMEFTDISDNIIMLNTSDEVYGIGHSSTVLGPNMDTYYIVYHSFKNAGSRETNIDVLYLNGTDFSVAGPTTSEQQAPEMPHLYTDSKDFSEEFTYASAELVNEVMTLKEKGTIISNEVFSAQNFTAEVNFLNIENKAGILLSYTNENTYSIAYVDANESTLVITSYNDGKKTADIKFELPTSFGESIDFTKLQALKVTKEKNVYNFYLNGLLVGNYKMKLLNGKFGVISESGSASVGYMAISLNSNNSSLKTFCKPIEGKIYASHALEKIETTSVNGVLYAKMEEGETYTYNVNASTHGSYDIEFAYICADEATIEIYKNGRLLGSSPLTSSPTSVSYASLRNISIDEGFGTIQFKISKGEVNMLYFDFSDHVDIIEGAINLSSPYYSDGTWNISSSSLILSNETAGIAHGKIIYGDENWGDYSVSADFTCTSTNKMYGLIVRASNPSLGGAGNDSIAGKDFVCGYYFSFTSQGIAVYKLNYKSEFIETFKAKIESNKTYNLKVIAEENTFKIYLNNSCIGEFTDENLPHLNGGVGVSGMNSDVKVKNIIVSHP